MHPAPMLEDEAILVSMCLHDMHDHNWNVADVHVHVGPIHIG
jgi:hypothetical protein